MALESPAYGRPALSVSKYGGSVTLNGCLIAEFGSCNKATNAPENAVPAVAVAL